MGGPTCTKTSCLCYVCKNGMKQKSWPMKSAVPELHSHCFGIKQDGGVVHMLHGTQKCITRNTSETVWQICMLILLNKESTLTKDVKI